MTSGRRQVGSTADTFGRRALLRGILHTIAASIGLRARASAQGRPATFVVLVDGSSQYHAPGCALVRDNATARLLPFGDAQAKGITPHAECHDASRATGGASRARGGATRATTYWLDVKTRRYHRAGCGLIGLPRVQISLARAIEQKHLPCRSCRPETTMATEAGGSKSAGPTKPKS